MEEGANFCRAILQIAQLNDLQNRSTGEDGMEMVLSSLSASISELKKDPMALLEEAEGKPVAILHNNHPFAYLVPANVYEDMLELIEDYKLDKMIRERLAKEKDNAIAVSLENL